MGISEHLLRLLLPDLMPVPPTTIYVVACVVSVTKNQNQKMPGNLLPSSPPPPSPPPRPPRPPPPPPGAAAVQRGVERPQLRHVPPNGPLQRLYVPRHPFSTLEQVPVPLQQPRPVQRPRPRAQVPRGERLRVLRDFPELCVARRVLDGLQSELEGVLGGVGGLRQQSKKRRSARQHTLAHAVRSSAGAAHAARDGVNDDDGNNRRGAHRRGSVEDGNVVHPGVQRVVEELLPRRDLLKHHAVGEEEF